ncbi:MAG: hypothetical protein M1838_003740 [Thelocarpon superellum]|nr:MAG: hypothetical protein M1838_003740 [Thelocarpon superellum]
MSLNHAPAPVNGVLRFYEGLAGDFASITMADLLRPDWDTGRSTQEFLPLVFPLAEHTADFPDVPIVDREAFEAFCTRPYLRGMLRAVFHRILRHYGFDIRPALAGDFVYISDLAPSSRAWGWLSHDARERFRVARIIRSLRILGFQHLAQQFYHCVVCGFSLRDNDTPDYRLTSALWKVAALGPLAMQLYRDPNQTHHLIEFLRPQSATYAAVASSATVANAASGFAPHSTTAADHVAGNVTGTTWEALDASSPIAGDDAGLNHNPVPGADPADEGES